jgi:hypothetical protein
LFSGFNFASKKEEKMKLHKLPCRIFAFIVVVSLLMACKTLQASPTPEPPGRISGQVIYQDLKETDDPEPLAGILVVLCRLSGESQPEGPPVAVSNQGKPICTLQGEPTVSTSEDGSFILEGVTPATYLVMFQLWPDNIRAGEVEWEEVILTEANLNEVKGVISPSNKLDFWETGGPVIGTMDWSFSKGSRISDGNLCSNKYGFCFSVHEERLDPVIDVKANGMVDVELVAHFQREGQTAAPEVTILPGSPMPTSTRRAPTSTPTSQPLTAAAAEQEVQASKLEEIAGVWLEKFTGGSAQIEIKPDGTTIFTILSGGKQGYQDQSKSWFENGELKVKTNGSQEIGIYKVFIARRDGRAVEMRYVLVEDPNQARRQSMTYAPLTIIAPAATLPSRLPTATSEPALATIPGIDAPITIKNVNIKNSLGLTETVDIGMKIVDAIRQESLKSGTEPIQPKEKGDIFLSLKLALEGSLNAIEWIALNALVVCGDETYQATNTGIEFSAGLLKNWYVHYPIPAEVSFVDCSVQLPDGREIPLGRFFYGTLGGAATSAPLKTSTPTSGASAPAGGKIVFISERDGNPEIYSMHADGTNQTRLTRNTVEDTEPAWSPDGAQIAFASKQDDDMEIYLMDAEGGNLIQLTDNTVDDMGPTWSPDGTQIAYYSIEDGDWEIMAMSADGSNPHKLTNNQATDTYPAWSPDGKKIVFHSYRDQNWEIYLMDANGRNQRRLTIGAAEDWLPAWSPDGKQIAFWSKRSGQWEVYSMAAGGANQIPLTKDSGVAKYISRPAWSPDGKSLVVVVYRDQDPEIYLVSIDGLNWTRLTNTPRVDADPDWTP